jgi:hypothetical protein
VPYGDAAVNAAWGEDIARATAGGGFLLGRRTYLDFIQAWPKRATAPTDAGRQVWNIGPEDGHPWTVLDDLPMPTDHRIVPHTCPIRWSVRDPHGHSRTDR